jgi:hypothetical protein
MSSFMRHLPPDKHVRFIYFLYYRVSEKVKHIENKFFVSIGIKPKPKQSSKVKWEIRGLEYSSFNTALSGGEYCPLSGI